jgi:SAM-dependent methyltransferase
MESTFKRYADGNALYGEDLSADEIETWFRDEERGYFGLHHDRRPGAYTYHALNVYHGFRHLPTTSFQHVLGFGSAFGDELEPILDRAHKVTILEPANGFARDRFVYVKPSPSGRMPFDNNTFDLITCFGVLHHIPNVSTVMGELARCLTPGGWLLIREPVVSMGDWDEPRPGLTARERGIPWNIMRRIVRDVGLVPGRGRLCGHSLSFFVERLLPKGYAVYNSPWLVRIDDRLSNLPIWPRKYHATNAFQKLRAGSAFLVLQKSS